MKQIKKKLLLISMALGMLMSLVYSNMVKAEEGTINTRVVTPEGVRFDVTSRSDASESFSNQQYHIVKDGSNIEIKIETENLGTIDWRRTKMYIVYNYAQGFTPISGKGGLIYESFVQENILGGGSQIHFSGLDPVEEDPYSINLTHLEMSNPDFQFSTNYDSSFVGGVNNVKRVFIAASSLDVDQYSNYYLTFKLPEDNTGYAGIQVMFQTARLRNLQNPITLLSPTYIFSNEKYTIQYESVIPAVNMPDNSWVYVDENENEILNVSNVKPSSPDKIFIGWKEKGNPDSPIYGTDMGQIAEHTFTGRLNNTLILEAVWEDPKGILQFDSNGATGSTLSDLNLSYNENITLPEPTELAYEGYNFKEWNTQADGKGISYASGSSFTYPENTESLKLYAIWDPKTYTVTFKDGLNNAIFQPIGYQLKFNDTIPSSIPVPNRLGYEFIGWSPELDHVVIESKEYVAQWKARDYKIMLDANEGIYSLSSIDARFDTISKLPTETPLRENYSFLGWNTHRDGSGILYMAGSEVINLSNGSNVTLYAQWQEDIVELGDKPNLDVPPSVDKIPERLPETGIMSLNTDVYFITAGMTLLLFESIKKRIKKL